jgi:hypothetical protein
MRWMLTRRQGAYVMGMVLAGLVLGWFAARPGDLLGHRTIPVTTADAVFRSFDLPEPTDMPVDHDYEARRYVAPTPSPTATPKPAKSAKPKVVPAEGHTARGSGVRTIPNKRVHRNISGTATWHATGRDGPFAAAGPLLRKAIGPGWRGNQVLVCLRARCIIVTLSDWCLCSHNRRLVDLSDEAFRALAPLSRGVLKVSVGW